MKIITKSIFIILLSISFLQVTNDEVIAQDCGLRDNQSARPSQVKERVSNRKYCRKQIQLSILSRPQINFGYHINDIIYFGGMLRAPYKSENKESYDVSGLESGSSEQSEGYRLGAELRFSPFKLGFYAALGAIYSGEDKVTNTYDKRSRNIGSNTYNTAIDMDITRKPAYAVAYGLGFIHVFDSGFSLGAGTLWSKTQPDLAIDITGSDTTIAASDLSAIEDDIIDTEKDNIVDLFYLSIGYNF